MIITAASDVKYFIEHSIAFAKSAAQTKSGKVCLFVSPDFTQDTKPQFLEFVQFIEKTFLPSLSDEEKAYIAQPCFLEYSYNCKTEDKRAYFASLRFLLMPALLEKSNSVMALDIDCFFNKGFSIGTEYDLGLYLRESNQIGSGSYEQEGMKVAAGIFYITKNAKPFADDVYNHLLSNPLKWFVDQHAIFNAYKKYKENYKILDFSKTDILDWDFKPNTCIWTGKGPRKHENQTYLARKKEIENGYL